MEAFLIETLILTVIFIVLHYSFNKDSKMNFFSVLITSLVLAAVVLVFLKYIVFKDGPGIGTEDGAIKA